MSPEFEPEYLEELRESGYDPYHAGIVLLPGMIYEARSSARRIAINHREDPFIVGASLLAVDIESDRHQMFTGANYKPTKDADPYCAEMSVIDQAEDAGFDHGVLLVIAGTSNTEKIRGVSGIATPTLHPCKARCQPKMRASKLFGSDTLVLPVSLEENFYEVFTYNELILLYDMDDTEELEDTHITAPTYSFDPFTWEHRARYYDELSNHSNNMIDPPALAKMALTATVRID